MKPNRVLLLAENPLLEQPMFQCRLLSGNFRPAAIVRPLHFPPPKSEYNLVFRFNDTMVMRWLENHFTFSTPLVLIFLHGDSNASQVFRNVFIEYYDYAPKDTDFEIRMLLRGDAIGEG